MNLPQVSTPASSISGGPLRQFYSSTHHSMRFLTTTDTVHTPEIRSLNRLVT